METLTLALTATHSTLSLIRSVDKMCPSLTTLSLNYDGSDTQLLHAVSELVCKIGDIGSLSISGLTTPAVTCIASFTKLHTLKLGGFKADDMLLLSDSSFPELSELALTTEEDAGRIGEFIAIIRPKKLKTLALEILDGSCPSGEWERYFRVVTSYCSGTLEDLRAEEGDVVWDVIHTMERTAFEPLFALRQLRHFSVWCGSFCLGNDDLKQMALSWPRLRTLSIHSCSGLDYSTSFITLNGLVPLLEHCPDLCELGIILDAASVVPMPSPLARPGGGVSNHNIDSMTVGSSTIQDPRLVAAFLSDILPNLKEIHWEEDEEYDLSSLWDQVQDLLPIFGQVRKQERAWCASKHKTVEGVQAGIATS